MGDAAEDRRGADAGRRGKRTRGRVLYRMERRVLGSRASQGWQLRRSRPGVVLVGPDGTCLPIATDGGARCVLERIRAAAPDALAVVEGCATQIVATGQYAHWLPRYLAFAGSGAASDPAGGGAENGEPDEVDDDEACQGYDDFVSDSGLEGRDGLILGVNGRPWAVVESPEGEICVPTDGLSAVWAEWSFIEAGGMTSGWDHATFGLLTPTVGAWFERLDDLGTQIELFDPQDAAGAFVHWVSAGWAVSEYWGEGWPFEGRQPLVAGFRDVIESGEAGACFAGSDYASGEGIGMTDTSEWDLSLHIQDPRLRRVMHRGLVAVEEGWAGPRVGFYGSPPYCASTCTWAHRTGPRSAVAGCSGSRRWLPAPGRSRPVVPPR